MDTIETKFYEEHWYLIGKEVLSISDNIFTIIASGIAIYLFLFKRNEISKAFKTLVTYSSQISLTELKFKLERLNELNYENLDEKKEIVNIFNDIVGQLQGNKMLSEKCESILNKLKKAISKNSGLTEPKKRSLVSELRES